MKPIVAIVGRPNVGKSTLFNRLFGRRKAMVDDMPGVTRDRNYGDVTRYDRPFTLIDTGGFEPVTDDRLLQQMREQSQLAIEEADIILFVMDGRQGMTPADTEVVDMLRRVQKPVFYVINKIDGDKLENEVGDFYSLGVENLYTISAEHNRGVGDLIDEVIKAFPSGADKDEEEDIGRIAVVGRPNVGKSSLVNKLLGYERVVANALAGTTRDSIDTRFTWHGRPFLLIDTAGIRRKGRVSAKIEKYSVVDSLRSIERADVVLIVIDAEEGVAEQDTKIAGYAYEAGKACIFVVNKWDTLKKDNSSVGKFTDKIRMEFKYLPFAPIIFVSALTGQRVSNIMNDVVKALEDYNRRVSTADLNRVLEAASEAHSPPMIHGKRMKIYYGTQVATKPPTFVIMTNTSEAVHFSYERYLTNKIREAFKFGATPLRLIFKGKER